MAWEIMKDGSVRHRDRSLLEEVDVDADGMHIRLEVGTGHERCDMSTNLPMAVLVGLFERAGYTLELSRLPVSESEGVEG